MNNKELLPVIQEHSRLPINIQERLKKAGNVTKYVLLTSGCK